MNRVALVSSVIVMSVGLTGQALAGERGGSGKWTPIGLGTVVASICSFSGLEDQDHGQEVVPDVVPGETQTPHSENGNSFPPGVAAICQFLNPGKNPKVPPPPPAP